MRRIALPQRRIHPPRSLGLARSFHHSIVVASWNPFSKKKALLDSPSTIIPADPTVLLIRQKLHTETDTTALAEMLKQLQHDSVPGAHSFSLMNEVIKKLDRSTQQQQQQEHNDPSIIIPGLSLEQCCSLFSHVTHSIAPENYKSARFVPRLYLQITRTALKQGNNKILLQTLGQFIHYLNTLGYEDQLVKVLQQFHSEFTPEVTDKSINTVIDLLESSSSSSPHPSLLIKLIDLYPNSTLLYQLAVERTSQFVTNAENDIFSLDEGDLDAIGRIMAMFTQHDYNKHMLVICDLIGHRFPQEETKFLKHILLNENDAGFLNEDCMLITGRILLLQEPVQMDLLKQWQNTLISKCSKPQLMQLVWQLHTNGLNEQTQQSLTEQYDQIPDEYFEMFILSIVQSKHHRQYPQLIALLQDLGFDTTIETYTNLMHKYIQDRDSTQLKQIFQDSMMNGIDWSVSGAKILNKFFITLVQQEGTTNPKEVFQFSRRVKVHLNYLDSEAYNALVELTLQNRFIDDAIESFKQELPPLLTPDLKYNPHNYPQLYSTLFQWISESSEDAEDLWAVYQGFIKYFQVPAHWYFPMIQRLCQFERPDLAFQLFQDMKRIHRTTGSIPPPPQEIYVYLFKQFGRHTYIDGVETLDAIFKVDLTINSSLPLLNSIMDAYCSLKNFTKVSQVYDRILASPNGPNNETVSIMLKAHTFLSLNNVKNYWNNMDELGLLPDGDNFERYVIAHCYHGQPQLALEIAKEMEEVMDLPMTSNVLKSLYQWTKDDQGRLLVEEWAEREHSGIWSTVKDEVKSVVVPVLEVPKSMEELGPTQEELRLMKS